MHSHFPSAGCCGKESPCWRDHIAQPHWGGEAAASSTLCCLLTHTHTSKQGQSPGGAQVHGFLMSHRNRHDDVAEHVCVIKTSFSERKAFIRVSSGNQFTYYRKEPYAPATVCGKCKHVVFSLTYYHTQLGSFDVGMFFRLSCFSDGLKLQLTTFNVKSKSSTLKSNIF